MKGITQSKINEILLGWFDVQMNEHDIMNATQAIYNAIKPIQLPERSGTTVENPLSQAFAECDGFNRCRDEVIKLNGGNDE